MMLLYDDIIESADRGWTPRLLERLTDPELSDDEREKVIRALQIGSDPRCFKRLEGILTDRSAPRAVRKAAGRVLRGLFYVPPDVQPDKLRRWWTSEDEILRRHAFLSMDGLVCPEIVLAVASDPRHPWQADALRQMEHWFDTPDQEAVKIAGLSHADSKVRAAAAWVLLWDEPVAAEEPLLRATRDSVPEVAVEAANTLEYYPSRRTIRCLSSLCDHAEEKVRQKAAESLEALRGECLIELCCRGESVARHVRRWLRPVWNLLAFTEDELEPEDLGPRRPPLQELKETIPASDLLAMLDEPNTPARLLQDRLISNGWQGYSDEERQRLRAVLRTHSDPLVRDCAARAFAAWEDASTLLDLLDDDDFLVRKTSMSQLSTLPPTPGISELAWRRLSQPDFPLDTLATFVRHTDPATATRRLHSIVAESGRGERLRYAAVGHLCDRGAAEELNQLVSVLRERPAVTWALHIELLGAIAELRLPLPDVSHLQEVDNLHLQVALAKAHPASSS
jgi:HEAT repeat protein